MFVSRVGILSTQIESAILLRLTTHLVSNVSQAKRGISFQKTTNLLKEKLILI
ncbi:hypothetical protein PGS1_21246 [Enterobacter cloacae subsp. cloacae GS1]|nr:hypothetical protein PGS1_21246 [Enterobacter cloacae subsp. cloacae GS1]